MTAASPPDLSQLRTTLTSALVADVLDAMQLRHQVIGVPLSLASGNGVLIGRAKTTLWEDVDQIDPRPYELELAAVDALRPGEVLIAAAAGSLRSGVWGELLATAAARRGCVGVIVDGAVRDVAKLQAMDFVVFAKGTCPRDSLHRQRVTAIDVPVEIGGVCIEPRDVVVADIDGIVVVPRQHEATALAKALEKAGAENLVRDAIRAGMSATAAFEKYGVL